MIGAARWDEIDATPEWRATVVGRGWFTVYDKAEPERVLYAGHDQATAEAIVEWERRRALREGRVV